MVRLDAQVFRLLVVRQQAAKQLAGYLVLAWTHGVSESGGSVLPMTRLHKSKIRPRRTKSGGHHLATLVASYEGCWPKIFRIKLVTSFYKFLDGLGLDGSSFTSWITRQNHAISICKENPSNFNAMRSAQK